MKIIKSHLNSKTVFQKPKTAFLGLSQIMALCLFLGTPMLGYSQTFHAIICAATNDQNIAEGCSEDYKRMNVELIAIANSVGMPLKKQVIRGKQFEYNNIVNKLKALPIEEEDIVFFYYSGHGARLEDDQSKFPRMLLNPTGENVELDQLLALTEVDEILNKKKPRFRILMADCCNSVIPYSSADVGSVREPTPPPSFQIVNVQEENLKNLFGKLEGSIMVCSSQPGVPALGPANGGLFTTSFLHELQKIVIEPDPPANWTNLLQLTKKTTFDMSAHLIGEYSVRGADVSELKPQEAQFEIQLVTDKEEVAAADQEEEEKPIELSLSFMADLMKLGDSNRKMIDRIKMIQPIQSKWFVNGNIRVNLIGENGTVTGVETGNNFLKRIASSQRLNDLKLISSEKEGDKIKVLNIQEVYDF